MPKDLFIADSTGLYRRPKGLWTADSTGTYKPAKAASVAKVDGSYAPFWPLGATINSFTVVKGTPDYLYAKADWAATGAARYRLYSSNHADPVYYGTGSSVTFSVGPNEQIAQFTLRAYPSADDTVYSSAVVANYRAGGVPAPGNFRYSNLDYDSVVLAWNAVQGATSYHAYNSVSKSLLYSGTELTCTIALYASTKYDFIVVALIGSQYSPWSDHVSITSPAKPGPAAGAYSFFAVSASTWQTAAGYGWRPDSDGSYHGDGSEWGSTRGQQLGVFFYGNRPFTKLAGGRVTRCQVYMLRLDDSGISTAQLNHWGLHNLTGRPAGAPPIYNYADAGSLARGQDAYFDLPVSWGQALVDGTRAGISWGNVPARYMHAPSVASNSNIGRIVLTIG